MSITFKFSGLWFILCLGQPTKSIKKYFPGHYIQSWRKFKDFSRTSTVQTLSQLASQPASQLLASRAVSHLNSQSVCKSASQSACQLASQSVCQSVSQTVSQPVSQPASQPVSQSVWHSFRQLTSQPVSAAGCISHNVDCMSDLTHTQFYISSSSMWKSWELWTKI